MVVGGDGIEAVVLGTAPAESLPGLPSSRLPVPVKALNLGSSGSGAAAAKIIRQ